MAADNKLELVVEVDTNRANASIKSVNAGLSSIESTAANSACGASRGIDSMTASMVKGATAGNLLAEGIRKAIDFAKEWTVEAAQHAAHTDKMALSMTALAKAHGVSAESANQAVESVKKVGFGVQDAIHAVDRLIVADMSLSKAEGLAKVAKDAAAIENISPGEALEKLLMAIESGASRGLRTMGIFVDLNKEVQRQELLSGKTLGENEVRQLRYNAVMREAAKIQGTAAAAAGSAEAQSKALAREVNELKEAVGEQFQGYLRTWVGHLRELVGFLKDNSNWLVKFGEAAIFTAGAIATYGIITKIGAMATAVQGLATVLTAHPIALLLTGVAAGGAVIWKTWQDTKADLDRQYDDMRRKGLRQDLFSGKLKPADVKKMGYTDDQIREIVAGKRLLPGESWGDFGGAKLDISIGSKKELTDDDVRRIAEIRKKQGEAEKQATESYLRAVEERKDVEREQARARIEDSMKIIQATQSETAAARESLNVAMLSMDERAAGVAKIRDEERREIGARSTYVDEKSGAIQHFQLKPETLERIHATTRERIAAFEMKFNEEEARRIEEIWKAMGARQQRMFEQFVLKPIEQDLEIWSQSFELDERRKGSQLGIEKSAVAQRQQLALAQLEAVDAVTLSDKVAVEQRKTAIEVDAIRQRTAIELKEIDRRTEADIRAAERAMLAKGIFDDARQNQIRSRIRQLGQDEKDALEKSTANDISVAQIKGATQVRHTVTEQYRSIFQSLKEQAGGVFDALVTKSQSVWAAIGNSLKTALLTAIKDVVSSRIAAMLMNLFVPGANVQMRQGGMGGGGILGKLGAILGVGAVPVLGGGGSAGGGVFGSGPLNGNPTILSMMGGNGGGIGSGAAAGSGGLFSKAGLASFLPGLKSAFGIGGSVELAPGVATTWQAATMAQKLSSIGHSTGFALAGGMLALDGLRRGGITGLGETTAGGAMLGFKFGGPVGAAIGAAAGAVAGIVRLFVKGAQDKVREKIKATYGLDVSDKGVLKQIVDMAKQSYGGNLDLAIQSPPVRELLELYAMQTGQQWRGRNTASLPVSMIQSGGSVSFLPPTGQGGFTSVPWSSAAASPAATTPNAVHVTLSLDGPTTERVLQGQAITAIGQQPRAVAAAMTEAYDQNYSRRETYAGLSDPGLITSA